MQIVDRQYPYPVLNFYSSDFEKSNYEVYMNFVDSNDDEITLNIKFDLNCEILEKLIESEQASFAIHLECGRTRYRKLLKAKKAMMLNIKSKDVSGEIEILPLIVLNENVKEYSSNDFIEDFEGESFDIEKGSIVAIAEQRKVLIEKEGDNLQSVPSIFSIQKKEKSENGLDWWENGEKIIISLSEDKYRVYKMLVANKSLAAMTSILIIVPVLVEILADMRKGSDVSEDTSWMIVLKERMDKLKINIETDNLTQAAHKILDGALEESFETIKDILEEAE